VYGCVGRYLCVRLDVVGVVLVTCFFLEDRHEHEDRREHEEVRAGMASKDVAELSNFPGSADAGTWDNGTAPELEPSAKKQKLTPNRANPQPQRWGPPHTYSTKSDKIICVMVGLPARGKSYISRRLSQYLSFFYNVPCKMFNVGDYRRKAAGNLFQDADFFDTNNATAMALRREATEAAMLDLCSWMKGTCTEPKGLHNADGSPRPTPPGDGHTFVSGDFGAVYHRRLEPQTGRPQAGLPLTRLSLAWTGGHVRCDEHD
jgi:hypothetical protein